MPAYTDYETSERFAELVTMAVDGDESIAYVDVRDASDAGWLVPEGDSQLFTFETDEGSETFMVTVRRV